MLKNQQYEEALREDTKQIHKAAEGMQNFSISSTHAGIPTPSAYKGKSNDYLRRPIFLSPIS